jgi:CheY-like chemotaxis protein
MNAPAILIVDDEEDLREAIAFDFKRKKFKVLTAGSGREAMKVIEANPVNVVLSDMRMANGDGMELLEWIKARHAFIPVVMFITGYADIALEEAYDKGAEAVFSKPFDRKVLFSTVEKAMLSPEEKFERKGGRVEIDIPAGLSFSGQRSEARAVNIGRGGIFAEIQGNLPKPGEKVDFRLGPLPDSAILLSGSGVVRWVREGNESETAGCGIEFTELDPSCVRQILRLINDSKTKAFIPLK